MYFEAALHDGRECWDGGLKENNPVQVAVNEVRTIWGSDAIFDLIISLGCGQAKKPQRQPSSKFILTSWLSELLTTLLESMNGNKAWDKFRENNSEPILERCHRLNVNFLNNNEPELDDVKKIEEMEELATSFRFHYQVPRGNFAPVASSVGSDQLEVLASCLKASLYFFELESITQQDDVSIIKGWICCRLHPDKKAYKPLREQTSYFEVKGKKQDEPSFQDGFGFMQKVSFQQQVSKDSEPIRIDVKFDHSYLVSISGFPMTLKVGLQARLQVSCSLTYGQLTDIEGILG